MCGRMGLSVDKPDKIYERFEVSNEVPDFRAHYNTPPGTNNPVITKHSPNKISYMHWGILPFFMRHDDKGRELINAQAEGIATKSTWKKSFIERRCVIPATHYFEWDRKTKPTTPFKRKPKSLPGSFP